ncbi:hypothetical protein [Polaromonas sp.]|nr:hypothetical protein [Polaromonas sp.]MDI1275578.1 hypothetical protein [Polaromonas sp.]
MIICDMLTSLFGRDYMRDYMCEWCQRKNFFNLSNLFNPGENHVHIHH